MVKQFVVPFVANLLAIGMIGLGAIGAEMPTPGETQKSKPGSVVMNYDMTAGWFQVQVHDMHADWWQIPESVKIQKDPDAEAIKKMFEEIVDRHAEAHIDAVVHCVWTSFETWMPNCRSAQPRKDGYDVAPNRLLEGGHDMIQVILERSRKQKIQFLAGLRMNDRHGVAQKRKFYVEHPEWRLEGLPGGLDYKHEGVRSAVLAFVEEFLDAYDVDGIEFDYMRWCHVFKPSEAGKHAPLLTDFTSKARKLLDKAAKKRGRGRLLLGVRVPQTIEECTRLGFDVAAWIKEGLVDYVCPSDFFYTDFNAGTEDFVKLAEGTDCKVYPSIHPVTTQGNRRLLTAAHYRAAAKNFYGYGAHGVSTYNYQYHWQGMIHPDYPGPPEMWPKALSYLTELRDPELLAKADRHYLYHPLWSRACPTGAVKNDRIVLDRGAAEPHGTFRFQMAEDLTDTALSAVLEFKVTGMVEGDELEVQINGKVIPADQIRRSHDADGQSKAEGRPLPAFYLYEMDLTSPPAKFGDNELSVRLAKSGGSTKAFFVKNSVGFAGSRGAEKAAELDGMVWHPIPGGPVTSGAITYRLATTVPGDSIQMGFHKADGRGGIDRRRNTTEIELRTRYIDIKRAAGGAQKPPDRLPDFSKDQWVQIELTYDRETGQSSVRWRGWNATGGFKPWSDPLVHPDRTPGVDMAGFFFGTQATRNAVVLDDLSIDVAAPGKGAEHRFAEKWENPQTWPDNTALHGHNQWREVLLTGKLDVQEVEVKVQVKAKQDRKQAAHRRRRVIYNDDGGAVWGSGGTRNSTPETFLRQRMANALDSHVDTVYFNTVMWADRFSHLPKVGEFVTESMVDNDTELMKGLCLDFKQLADAGKDAMQLTLEFCREHGLEFVWTYRINDIHDGFEIRQLATLKRDNPHLMLGNQEDGARFPSTDPRRFWTAFDFAQEAVRKRRLDVIEDVLARYDVDGIDLDFFRHPIFFASTMEGKAATRAELDLITDLVRKVRELILAASRRRGRPVLLSVRTPVTLEQCHRIGLEIDKWLAEGLVDVLVLGGGYMPLTMPAKGLIDLGHKHGVPVYPCLSASALRDTHRLPEAWQAAASNLFADGADGVMTFNYFPAEPSEIFQTIGEPEVLAGLDKMYGIDRSVPGGYAWHAVPQKGALPRPLEVGKDAGLMPFPVGDDLAAAEGDGKLKSIELCIKIDNLADDQVELTLNGNRLQGVRRDGVWLKHNPAASLVQHGRNQLGVVLQARAEGATKPLAVTDVQLWARYNH